MHSSCFLNRYALISPQVRPDPLPLLGSGVTKDRGVDSETDKRKHAQIKGKSDVDVQCSRR